MRALDSCLDTLRIVFVVGEGGFIWVYSADYKTSARRNADAKLEVSGAVRHTSATCAGVKKSLGSDGVHTSETLRNADVAHSSLNCRVYTREQFKIR